MLIYHFFILFCRHLKQSDEELFLKIKKIKKKAQTKIKLMKILTFRGLESLSEHIYTYACIYIKILVPFNPAILLL